jgi:hypothetical protein
VIALVSWHRFAKYSTTTMEVALVPCTMYRTVFLQIESPIVAI